MSAGMAAFAMGGANMYFSYKGQKDAIRAASKYNKKMRNNEVIGLMYQNRGRTTQQMQVEQSIAHEKLQAKIANLQAQGQARVAGAASGLTGRSFDNMIRSIQEQTNKALSTLDANFKNSKAVYAEEIAGNQFSAQSRIESNTQKPKFSWMSLLQSGISGAASGYSMGKGFSKTLSDGAATPTKNAGASLLTIPKK